jgi:hypothetical protein
MTKSTTGNGGAYDNIDLYRHRTPTPGTARQKRLRGRKKSNPLKGLPTGAYMDPDLGRPVIPYAGGKTANGENKKR